MDREKETEYYELLFKEQAEANRKVIQDKIDKENNSGSLMHYSIKYILGLFK